MEEQSTFLLVGNKCLLSGTEVSVSGKPNKGHELRTLVALVTVKKHFSEHLFSVVWRTGTKPILTIHDGRRQFGLSGVRTCDHVHASPELYHCDTDADSCQKSN